MRYRRRCVEERERATTTKGCDQGDAIRKIGQTLVTTVYRTIFLVAPDSKVTLNVITGHLSDFYYEQEAI